MQFVDRNFRLACIDAIHVCGFLPRVFEGAVQNDFLGKIELLNRISLTDEMLADSSGSTPLHWAIIECNVESVRLLLDAGANVDTKDNEGRRPSYWCKSFGELDFWDDQKKKEISNLLADATGNASDRSNH
jgi:hypothetical protein